MGNFIKLYNSHENFCFFTHIPFYLVRAPIPVPSRPKVSFITDQFDV